MLLESSKIPSCAGITRIPQFHYMGVRDAELTDKREDLYDVGNHSNGILMGHALLALQEVAASIHATHHHSVPVVIAVKRELSDTGPLKSGGPQHCCLILLIEQILRVNEDEASVLVVLIPPQNILKILPHISSPKNKDSAKYRLGILCASWKLFCSIYIGGY